MNRLYEVLFDSGAVSPESLTRAQKRRQLYAGSLDTNLLELSAIHARALDRAIAKALDLPSVPPASIENILRPTADVASALRDHEKIAPLALAEDGLWVAVHPEINVENLQELRERFPAVQFAATAECCFEKIAAEARNIPVPARSAALCRRYLLELGATTPHVANDDEEHNDVVTTMDERPSDPMAKIALERQRLEHLRDRDAITECLQRAALFLSPRVALFSVRSDGLHGLAGPSGIPGIAGLVVPISAELERGLSGEKYIERCSDLDLRLAVNLEESVPCLFAPVTVNHRTVLVLYVDRAGKGFSDDEVEALYELCGVAGASLVEVVLQARKLPIDASARDAVATDAIVPGPPPIRPESVVGAQAWNRNVAERAAHSDNPSSLRGRLDLSALDPLADIEAPRLTAGVLSGIEVQPHEEDENAQTLVASTNNLRAAPKVIATTERAATAEPSPTHSSTANELDKAIASLDREYFIRMGPPAVAALATTLPGPLEDPHAHDPDRVSTPSQVGPVLRLLVELQSLSFVPVFDRLRTGNAEQRYFAALVFQELRDARAIEALAERCFDRELNVRRLAARVLETYHRDPGFALASHRIRAGLSHPAPEQRLYAICAAGVIRDPKSVALLIDRLDKDHKALRRGALEALCSITGQQLGFKAPAWRSWHVEHQHEHRLEWVASALAHSDRRVRLWAADELARLTGRDPQFDADAPERERHAAIERWRAWWKENGQQSQSAVAEAGTR